MPTKARRIRMLVLWRRRLFVRPVIKRLVQLRPGTAMRGQPQPAVAAAFRVAVRARGYPAAASLLWWERAVSLVARGCGAAAGGFNPVGGASGAGGG